MHDGGIVLERVRVDAYLKTALRNLKRLRRFPNTPQGIGNGHLNRVNSRDRIHVNRLQPITPERLVSEIPKVLAADTVVPGKGILEVITTRIERTIRLRNANVHRKRSLAPKSIAYLEQVRTWACKRYFWSFWTRFPVVMVHGVVRSGIGDSPTNRGILRDLYRGQFRTKRR